MIKVVDISHHQGKVDFDKMKSQGVSAIFLKCTQGTGYKDTMYLEYKQECRKRNISLGFYHFAGNLQSDNKTTIAQDPIKEAEHFLKNVGDILPGEIIILDWEPTICNISQPLWVRTFLDYVSSKIGFKPIFYTYENRLLSFDWKPVYSGNYGLWVADYGVNDGQPHSQPVILPWKFYVLWQYTSKGPGKTYGVSSVYVDLNQGNITLDTLKKYGKPSGDSSDGNLYQDFFKKICKILNFNDFGDNMNEGEANEILGKIQQLSDNLEDSEKKVIDLTNENAILKERIVSLSEKKVDTIPDSNVSNTETEVVAVIPPVSYEPKLTLGELLRKLFKLN